MPKLPEAVAKLDEAVKRGDTDAFLALFPEDGVVIDWGRRFTGRSEIRRWSDKEFIGAKGVLTIETVTRKGNEVTITADWKSRYFSGASHMVFIVDGAQIREMRILET